MIFKTFTKTGQLLLQKTIQLGLIVCIFTPIALANNGPCYDSHIVTDSNNVKYCFYTCCDPLHFSMTSIFYQDESSCAAACQTTCSGFVQNNGWSTDCTGGTGGSSYGGCMGGGYTTGGKPAPKGGPEPKNIKSK